MRNLVLLPALAVSSLVATQDVSAQVRVQTAPGGYAYSFGDPDRPMIGVSTRSSGKRDTLGLLVESVTRDGPAEKAGLRPSQRVGGRLLAGDVILKLDGKPVTGVESLNALLERYQPNQAVKLTIFREGQEQELPVTLGNPGW